MTLSLSQKRIVRHKRIRSRISGTAVCPRLAVYRSNAQIYAQLIDDVAGKTLASAHDMKSKKGSKIDNARTVGAEIAKKLKLLVSRRVSLIEADLSILDVLQLLLMQLAKDDSYFNLIFLCQKRQLQH